MPFHQLSIPGVLLINSTRFSDDRGYFSEIYSHPVYSSAGIDSIFVQDNESLSVSVGTVRGLHFQAPPFAQAKLVRVIEGAIFDVAVDIRKGSATYGRWVGAELTAHGGEQLFIPRGFAHGFCTLKPNTRVVYKVDSVYSRDHDHGIHWCDPNIAITWPLLQGSAVISQKDTHLPLFDNFISPF